MASRSMKVTELLKKGKSPAEGQDPNWSPNNVKTVILTDNMAYIEHYTRSGIYTNWWDSVSLADTKGDTSSALDAIFKGGIRYSALFEIIGIYSASAGYAAYKADWEKYKEQIGRESMTGERDLLETFKRLSVISVFTVPDAATIQKMYEFIVNKSVETRKSYKCYSELIHAQKLPNVKPILSVLLEKNKPLLERTWWQAGIYDDRLDKNKRVLRYWLYAIDANPTGFDEAHPDSMPIYKALMACSEPILAQIKKKEQEKAEQEAHEKVVEKIEKANSNIVATEKQKALRLSQEFDGCDTLLFDIQRKRLELYLKNRDLQGIIAAHPDNFVTGCEETTKLSQVRTGFLAASLYNSDKRHTTTWFTRCCGLDANFLYELFDNDCSLRRLASKLSRGLRLYYMSNIGIKGNALGYMQCLEKDNSFSVCQESDNSYKSLNNYVQGILTNNQNFAPMKAIERTEEIKCKVEDFESFLNIVFETEYLSAVIAFIKTIPIWGTDLNFAQSVADRLIETSGFGSNFLNYNTELLSLIEKSLPKSETSTSWRSIFSTLHCTSFVNGNVYKSWKEYAQHTDAILDMTMILLSNRQGG